MRCWRVRGGATCSWRMSLRRSQGSAVRPASVHHARWFCACSDVACGACGHEHSRCAAGRHYSAAVKGALLALVTRGPTSGKKRFTATWALFWKDAATADEQGLALRLLSFLEAKISAHAAVASDGEHALSRALLRDGGAVAGAYI